VEAHARETQEGGQPKPGAGDRPRPRRRVIQGGPGHQGRAHRRHADGRPHEGVLEGAAEMQQAGFPQQVSYQQTVAVSKGAALISGESALLPHGAVSPSLMLAGIHRENYRMLPAGEEQGWLCLNVDDENCWALSLLPKAELASTAQRLQENLIALNRSCEGFHLLEHLLLRPRGGKITREVPEDFYAHRVSVVLPAFTARFADPGCRAWMEELIAQNLPAHIFPEFYWLDFAFLAEFELHYREWLALLHDAVGGSDEVTERLDASADQLIDFLKKASAYRSNRFWL